MAGPKEALDAPPIGVIYAPQAQHPSLPVEVLTRSDIVNRITCRELSSRQRADFHQLVVCTEGSGTHHVDFVPVTMHAGSVLRIFPGQVQQFVLEQWFEAVMMVWPAESHHQDPLTPVWYPGSSLSTHWQVDDSLLAELLDWMDEIRSEQAVFDGGIRRIALLRTMLAALLLRLAIELPESSDSPSRLPEPYVAYRQLIEERLYERPTVLDLARQLGFSSRTVDRACQEVSGQTARQILDGRLALEVRRALTHTSLPIARIAHDLGFSDPSNFSKFVKRHLGRLPGEIRAADELG